MIKIAIIGAGYIACEHIKAFQDINNVEVVGIYSRTKTKAEVLASRYNIELVADSIEDLHSKTFSDGVVIAVSVSEIYNVTLECFKYNWKCLIEKPAGYNLEEAQLLNKYAIQNNIVAYVALNRRHYSSTSKILVELMATDSKRIVKIQDQEDIADPIRIGHPDKVIKNWMYSNSIHLIDYFTFLCRGNLLKVSNIINWDSNIPHLVIAKLEYDSGDIGIYEAIWNAPSPWIISVVTSEARWEMAPLETLTKQDRGTRVKNQINIDKWDLEFKPGLRKQAKLFVDILQGENANLPTLNDSIKTMKLIKYIYNQ